MIKDSALVSIISVQELLWRAQRVGQSNFRILETLLLAALVYWVMTICSRSSRTGSRSGMAARRPCKERSMTVATRPAPMPADPRHQPDALPGALVPPGAEPIVRALALEKFFGTNHVLRGCTLEVYPRETICAHRPVRLGQEHALRCINFLEEPTPGSIEVDGMRVRPIRSARRSQEHREQIRQIRLRARWCSRSSTCSRT